MRKFDQGAIKAMEGLPPSIEPVMLAASFVGAPAAMAVLMMVAAALTWMTDNSSLLRAELVVLALLPVAVLIKVLTNRPRPPRHQVGRRLYRSSSFPSGHAYGTLLTLGLFAYQAYTHLPSPSNTLLPSVLATFIVIVGASRVYLGYHFPSDVVAGWLLALAVLVPILKLFVV